MAVMLAKHYMDRPDGVPATSESRGVDGVPATPASRGVVAEQAARRIAPSAAP